MKLIRLETVVIESLARFSSKPMLFISIDKADKSVIFVDKIRGSISGEWINNNHSLKALKV
jgi:hypothetical protein